MKRNSMKRIISLFIATLFVFFVVPFATFAQNRELTYFHEYFDSRIQKYDVYTDNSSLYHTVGDTISYRIVAKSYLDTTYKIYIYELGKYNERQLIATSEDGYFSYTIPSTLEIGKRYGFGIFASHENVTDAPLSINLGNKEIVEGIGTFYKDRIYLSDKQFNDTGIDCLKWYASSVNELSYLHALDVYPFTNSNKFSASTRDVTRGLAASIIGSQLYSGDSNPSYKDVTSSHIYYEGIMKAKNVMVGNNGYFSPDKLITKQELVMVLYNYFMRYEYYKYDRYNPYEVYDSDYALLDKFVDKDNVSNWAKKAMVWAIKRGVISGTQSSSGLYINPKSAVSRGEACVMIAKVMPD